MSLFAQKSRLLWLLGLILGLGFLGISLLGFVAAQNAIRSSIVDQSLPLAGDTVYSEVQRQLLRPIFISAQMAENTFLKDWVDVGEPDSTALVRYLGNIKKKFNTNTSFFVSEATRRYYYDGGILKIISPTEARDQWYYNFKKKNVRYELSADPDQTNQNQMTIFINYRLQDDAGKFLGVTGVGVAFDTLNNQILSLEKRFAQRVYFVNQSGEVILSDSKRLELRGSIKKLVGLSGVAGQILGSKTVQRTSFRQGATLVQVNSRFVPELGWFLLVEQDEAVATAPVLRLLVVNLLLGALATALVLSLIILAINQYQRRLERLATTDALTNAKNRSLGEALLEQAFKETVREPKNLSLMIFDIDDFKQVNDTFGHAAGDIVLQEVVKLASAVLRTTDTVVRWGGEEFLIILKNCPLENAQSLASQLQSQMAAHPFIVGSQSIKVTVSLGVAQLEPTETIAQLIKRADDAQYNAKRNGKNRVAVAKLAQVILI